MCGYTDAKTKGFQSPKRQPETDPLYKFMLLWTTYLLDRFLELLVTDSGGASWQLFPCYWGISCWSQLCMLHNCNFDCLFLERFFVSWIDWCWKNFSAQGGMWKLKNSCSEQTEELYLVTRCEKTPRFCRESFGQEWNRGACFCSTGHALVYGMSQHSKKLIWSRRGKRLIQSGILSKALDFHQRYGFLVGRSSGNMAVLLALTSNKLLK